VFEGGESRAAESDTEGFEAGLFDWTGEDNGAEVGEMEVLAEAFDC
jgi:hypothetical protein